MWVYESKKRGRSLTSSPEGIPTRGHVASKFRIVADFWPRHVSWWGHVAAVATITAVPWDGGSPRGPGPGPVDRTVWGHPEGGGTRRLTSMDLLDVGS